MAKSVILFLLFSFSLTFSFYQLSHQNFFFNTHTMNFASESIDKNSYIESVRDIKKAEDEIEEKLKIYRFEKKFFINNVRAHQQKLSKQNDDLPVSDPKLTDELNSLKTQLENKENEIKKLNNFIQERYKNGFLEVVEALSTQRKQIATERDNSKELAIAIIGLLIAAFASIPAWIELLRNTKR